MYTEIRSFEWDDAKARRNVLKHEISFEEATTAFHDFEGLIIEDADHSQTELRQKLIGLSAAGRLLTVIFTMRTGSAARIISTRPANRKEGLHYEQNRTFSV